MYATVTKGKTQRLRWIPEDVVDEVSSDHGVVYIYRSPTGKILAVAYRGKAAKSAYHYSYRNIEQARIKADEFLAGLADHRRRMESYRAELNAPCELKIGDIVYNSWGYEQTDVDWYVVTRTTQHFVWLQPIASEHMSEGCLRMSAMSVPLFDSDLKVVPTTKAASKHKAYGKSVTFKYGAGQLWNGTPKYESWYA